MSPFPPLARSLSSLRNVQFSTPVILFILAVICLNETPKVPGDSPEKLSEQNACPMA